MADSDKFLKLTDEDGDPLYIKSDVQAIWTKSETHKIQSMFGDVRESKGPASRGILTQSSGQWGVSNTYEEILAEIDRVAACESSE